MTPQRSSAMTGAIYRAARIMAQYNQQELADAAKINVNTISRIERGYLPRMETVRDIVEALRSRGVMLSYHEGQLNGAYVQEVTE